ncbi:RagB/SusD family nutrient uptake outer membrane protein [Cyclobacterium qasimii]|uniref:Membrane protein n=1 Tax=Cyclobacterium qasimii TaxID=1350429 RepID=A0A512C655_9BACT|nr:RagB/SusD family nutrient uptake outer membrane protein [Cyclobacterium qasimii]GEO19703.1 membrane protein [Cyclobacterium qasimii]
MKLINKTIKYIGLSYLAFGMFSCDQGLDLIPPGEVSELIYWQQEKDANLAVNGIYTELDGQTMVKELDGATDIGFRAPSGPGSLHDVSMGSFDPVNAAIGSQWDRYYRGIQRANNVLANIDRIEQGDQELLARYKAEARFLRAFFYTQLSSLWGDVPLILEPLEITDQIGRTAKSEVVDFVIAELDQIIQGSQLPLSYSQEVGRATLGAAMALKARVAIRNERYAVARDASMAVMDLGIYELYPDYGKLFNYAGQNSSEVIFDRQYAVGGDTYNAFSFAAASIGGGSVVEPVHNLLLKYGYKGPQNPNDPFENIDPRWNFTTYYTGQPIGNSTFNSLPDSPTADRVRSSEFSTVNGYNLKKWVDFEADAANPNTGSINMILIRYADVLLMYAESKIELNEIDDSVYDAINMVRERPTVEMPPIASGKSQEELRAIIRDERAVELAFEGLRLFDMNRWEIGEDKIGTVEGLYYLNTTSGEWETITSGLTRTFRPERDYLWPIPQVEIDINDNITQNPNY